MKYFDDVYTKKNYDTVKELNEAIAKFKSEQAAKEEEEKKRSVGKKELADAIDNAEGAIQDAVKNLKAVTDKTAKDIADARKRAQSIIDEAVAKAQKENGEAYKMKADAEYLKNELIKKFTEEYGTYTKVYTNEQAQKKMQEMLDTDFPFKSFFPSFFF